MQATVTDTQDEESMDATSEHQRTVSSAERPQYYRPELDILRFVAFLMVFASHSVPGDIAFYGQWKIPPSISHWIIHWP